MPTIEIECFIRHCTDPNVQRQDLEWRALKAVKVLKGLNLNGTFNFQINGMTTVISERNKAAFIEEILQRSAQRIRELFGNDVTLVAIPNSTALVSNRDACLTMRYAERIAKIVGGGSDSVDALRWSVAPGKAHLGQRERDVDQHLRNLRVCKAVEKGVILLDDVVTSGSQMYASKIALEDRGAEVRGMIAFAEVVGQGQRSDVPGWRRTTRTQCRMADLLDDFPF